MGAVKAFLGQHGEKIGLGGILLFFVWSLVAGLSGPAEVPGELTRLGGAVERVKDRLDDPPTALAEVAPVRPALEALYAAVPAPAYLSKGDWNTERRDAERAAGRVPFPEFADEFFYTRGALAAQIYVDLKVGGGPGDWLRSEQLPAGFTYADKIRVEIDGVATDDWRSDFEYEFDDERRRVRFTGLRSNWIGEGIEPTRRIVFVYFDAADPTKDSGSFQLRIEQQARVPHLYPACNVRATIPNPLRPGEVQVSWEADPRTNVERVGYVVERCEPLSTGDPGDWAPLTPSPIGGTSFLDTTAQPERRYLYRVRTLGAGSFEMHEAETPGR